MIKHRIGSIGNDVAADYIAEHLTSYGLDVSTIEYSSEGRNVIGKQVGEVNPDDVFIICAHYDAVADYGADDNASGVAAVLEVARILSNYSFENTIVYALWDEEETGLNGARNYANAAAQNNDNIVAVLNLDMIAYDGDNDMEFDIDVRNVVNSYQIKDDLINVVADYNLDLIANVVDPGTLSSDHSTFWIAGYSAVLLGEAWSNNDISPGYHTANDRINLFNIPYFYNMVKLCVGYVSTKGVLLAPTSTDRDAKLSFSAYPNPTDGPFVIDFENTVNGKLTVRNIYGEVLLTTQVKERRFKFDEFQLLSNGVYLLNIIDDMGRSVNFKVVKD